MTKPKSPVQRSLPLKSKSNGVGVPSVKAKGAPKSREGLTRPAQQRSPQYDPMIEALAVHEAEIVRLQTVILDLRGQQVNWLTPQMAQIPPLRQDKAIAITIDSGEIDRLTASLHDAWAELVNKQTHLQAAVDDNMALQGRVDGLGSQIEDLSAQRDSAHAELSQANAENATLKDELATSQKRLQTALNAMARQEKTAFRQE